MSEEQFVPWPIAGVARGLVDAAVDAITLDTTPEWAADVRHVGATATAFRVEDLVDDDPRHMSPDACVDAADELALMADDVRPVWPQFADRLLEWANLSRALAEYNNDGDKHLRAYDYYAGAR